MIRRLLGAVLAFALLFGGTSVVPAPTSAAGACTSITPYNGHYFVYKWYGTVGSNKFDKLTGQATVRDLDNCGFGTGLADGSAILPANIETLDGRIYQIGYQDRAAGGLRFIYAHGSTATLGWPGSMTPVIGNEYKFSITLPDTASEYVVYTIENKTTGATQTIAHTSTYGYTSASWGQLGWWGSESLDSDSGNGHPEAVLDIDMHHMSYRSGPSATTFYRSGLITRTSDPNRLISSPFYDMFKAPGLSPAACFHGTVSSEDGLTDGTFDPWMEEESFPGVC